MSDEKEMRISDHQVRYYENISFMKCMGNRSVLMVVMWRMYGLFQVFLEEKSSATKRFIS